VATQGASSRIVLEADCRTFHRTTLGG
jgi:hypothetical protein